MSVSLKSIKNQLNKLAAEYIDASSAKKQDILVRTADVISPLSESENKYEDRWWLKDVYDEMVNLIYCGKECIFDKYLKTYDTCEAFSNYIFLAAENNLKDKWKKESIKNNEIKDEDKNKRLPRFIPIEEKNGEGDTIFVPDIIGKNENSPEEEYEQKQAAVHALILFMELLNHQGILISKNNQQDIEFVRLMCTERFAEICKEVNNGYIHNELRNYETTAINAINTDFADHFYTKHCRNIGDFETVPYKKKKYFGIAQSPEEELEHPFKAKVYITFYKVFNNKCISDKKISEMKKKYDTRLDEFLIKKF